MNVIKSGAVFRVFVHPLDQSRDWSVYRAEKNLRHASYTRALADVSRPEADDRKTSSDIMPVFGLRHEAELRLVETIQVPTARLSRIGESRLHGAVGERSNLEHVPAATGDAEAGDGRKRVQGNFQTSMSAFRSIDNLINNRCQHQQRGRIGLPLSS